MRKRLWCAAAVAALAVGPVMAQPGDGPLPPPPAGEAGGPPPPHGGPGGPPPHRPNFHELLERADKDGDGAASFEDFKAVAPKFSQERFSELDRDSDGKVTREELPRPRGERGPGRGPDGRGEWRGGPPPGGPGGRGDMLRRADTDGNKEVTLEEFKAFMQMEAEHQFKRMDTNGDGVINAEDQPPRGPDGPRGEGFGRPDGPARQRGDGDGPPPGERPRQGDRPGQEMRERFRQADTDGDGRLSKDEALKGFPNMTEEVFRQRDRNGDGYLSREDRRPE